MRGDAELASVMRRMLEDEDTLLSYDWDARGKFYRFQLTAAIEISDEEANIITEVAGE